MNKKYLSFSVLLLSGCASMGKPDLVDVLGNMYVGGPVQAVAAAYGTPSEQREFEGQKIYIWHTSYLRRSNSPVQSTTTGTVGGGLSGYNSVPYSQTTTSNQIVTDTLNCRMEITVEPSGRVTYLEVIGKAGACEQFRPR